ncbi:MAG: rhodanese-like domain-containing protein [Pseudomonadota bacterium]
MKKYLAALVLCALALAPLSPAHADDMGISPQATYELNQTDQSVLFIDVRDPVEIMFIGFTDAVDQNIPYLLVDRRKWDAENDRFWLYQNPDFATEVEAALAARGLGKDAMIITMCRSGSERGEPSARFLRENGFPNARYVIGGFQGDSLKEGDKKGMRIVNGWQNSGLPWQGKPNPDKIYRLDNR